MRVGWGGISRDKLFQREKKRVERQEN